MERAADHRPVGGGEEEQKVRALEAGADDYVTKPFSPRELVARLHAALRRAAPGGDEPTLRAGEIELDLVARAVRRGGEEVHLTPIEFRLLKALMTRPGRLITHSALLTEVWAAAYADDVATLAPTSRTCAARSSPTTRAATSGPTPAWATASSPTPRKADPHRPPPLPAAGQTP